MSGNQDKEDLIFKGKFTKEEEVKILSGDFGDPYMISPNKFAAYRAARLYAKRYGLIDNYEESKKSSSSSVLFEELCKILEYLNPSHSPEEELKIVDEALDILIDP